MRERLDILSSIPGIGITTALMILVDMPEIGGLGGKQVASLAGLAPMSQSSGKWQGKARIQGGRASIITDLPCCDKEADRSSAGVCDRVQFGIHAALGQPDQAQRGYESQIRSTHRCRERKEGRHYSGHAQTTRSRKCSIARSTKMD